MEQDLAPVQGPIHRITNNLWCPLILKIDDTIQIKNIMGLIFLELA